MDDSNMTYSEQLNTLEWALKRQEILERDKNRCTKCGKEQSKFRNISKTFGINSLSDMEKKGYYLIEPSPTSYNDLKFKKGTNEIEVYFIGDTKIEFSITDLRFAYRTKYLAIKVLGTTRRSFLIALYPDMHRNEVTVDHNIHHKYYISGKMAWEYDDDAFATLCVGCHKETHNTTEIFTYSEKGEKLYLTEVCGRCEGSGYLEEFKHVQNGVCFKCFGNGVILKHEK